jgi:bifunctional non-homologous end joining protein LigD
LPAARDSLIWVEVSNPQRIVFPDDGISKGQVVAYYREIADQLLPFVSGRALTVERYPKGLGAKGFMQKNAPDHYPDDIIGRHEVPRDGGTTVYPVIRSREGIEFFANLGVITFHVPPSLVEDWRRPDWIIWDLDPPEGRLDLVREAARRLREGLERYSIPTQLMTSGSKGYHLRARIAAEMVWEEVAHIARGLGALVAADNEDIMTLAFRKSERGERVFVDWLRNAPYSTSVAPWSLRARPGAPVAAPLRWSELGEVAPDDVRLSSIDQRIDSDAWRDAKVVDVSGLKARIDSELVAADIALEPFDRFRS